MVTNPVKRLGALVWVGAILLSGSATNAGAQQRDVLHAVFATLDKVTVHIGRLEVAIDTPVKFGSLEITPRYCHKNPPEERAEVVVFVEVREYPGEEQGQGEKIFSGWMFASSPGLHALEHPIYDLWVIDCRTASGESS